MDICMFLGLDTAGLCCLDFQRNLFNLYLPLKKNNVRGKGQDGLNATITIYIASHLEPCLCGGPFAESSEDSQPGSANSSLMKACAEELFLSYH